MKKITDFSPTKPSFGKYAPFEREHEAWTMRCVEDYFREIGLQFDHMIVSTREEKREGIDAFCKLPGKFFGLQFKRAFVFAHTRPKATGIQWNLEADQFGKVKGNQSIFYVLPTFINRDLRRVALHHALFWRPDLKDGERLLLSPNESCVRYVQKDKSGSSNLAATAQRGALREGANYHISHAYRWGRLAEGLLDCSVGASTGVAKKAFADSVAQLLVSEPGMLDDQAVPMIVCRLHPLI